MVLKILSATAGLVPREYYTPIVVGVVSTLAIRAYARGRTTNRERDLHARVVILTGAFTPIGLTILHELAQRGAKVIALTDQPIDSDYVTTVVSAVREATKNENIFAEQCDMRDLNSVRAFCITFLTSGAGAGGEEHRIDCLLFAHEYRHVGSIWTARSRGNEQRQDEALERQENAVGSFLMVTLLLPVLLVAPAERDIRIVHVVNPLYAAAVPTFTPLPSALTANGTASSITPSRPSVFLAEGTRSLRTAVLTRHLQRVLDALPGAADVPTTDPRGKVQTRLEMMDQQRSNIVAVSVSPGISRVDTVAPWLGASRSSENFSWFGLLLYILLLPLLLILTKSSSTAIQSILHVLFLPTPFKQRKIDPPSTDAASRNKKASVIEERVTPEEVLRPGALYADCAVVRLNVRPIKAESLPSAPSEKGPTGGKPPEKGKGKQQGKGKAADDTTPPILQPLPDDGELGGETVGRLVWEYFEALLKEGEVAAKAREKAEKAQMDMASADTGDQANSEGTQ